MSLTEQDVTKIARLARIGLTPLEKQSFVKELSNIMKMIEQLQEVNTDNVEQLKNITSSALPMRKDVVSDGNIAADIVKNAPMSEYNCFVVPKVIE